MAIFEFLNSYCMRSCSEESTDDQVATQLGCLLVQPITSMSKTPCVTPQGDVFSSDFPHSLYIFPHGRTKTANMHCEICRNVSEAFCGNGDDHAEFELGSNTEICRRAETCPSCRQILDIYDKAIFDKAKYDSSIVLQIVRTINALLVNVYSGNGSVKRLKCLRIIGNREHDFLKVENPYIHLPRLRTWLDMCDESHHGRCHNLPKWQSVDLLKDLLLIDTEEGCLRQCPGTTKYFALSYLWGSIPDILETKMSNIEDLKQKGAFYSRASISSIPQTIRDSMKLVRGLNKRYLWVDRFCIVQDDPAKHAIISRMDSIYANAYYTIVATDGSDADHGLPGVQLARTSHQQRVNLPHGPLVTVTNVGYNSKYHTRGWTYQELNLSARQLVFANGSVFWACQASFWMEEMCGEPKDSACNVFFLLPYVSWPDLDAWELLCFNYSWRELSYEEDAHVAFSGIERVIERSFPAGFLYGLPEFFFDLTLLWFPDSRVNRRVKLSTDNGYCLPSWSWLGWHGRISMTPWIGGDTNHLVMSTHSQPVEEFRIEPLINWIQVGPTEGQERRVRNDFHLWRARGEENSSRTAGWRSKTTKQGRSYTNATIPGVAFRYPFPLAAKMPPEDEQRTWPPYLRLRSYRALFTIRPCRFETVPQSMVLLADTTGRWAGVIFWHCESQDPPIGESCELVAVSKGSAQQVPGGKTDTVVADLYWDELPKTNGLYEFYNVLWIKWEGDHVVREAVGRVEKSIWEQQELEPIDTQLH